MRGLIAFDIFSCIQGPIHISHLTVCSKNFQLYSNMKIFRNACPNPLIHLFDYDSLYLFYQNHPSVMCESVSWPLNVDQYMQWIASLIKAIFICFNIFATTSLSSGQNAFIKILTIKFYLIVFYGQWSSCFKIKNNLRCLFKWKYKSSPLYKSILNAYCSSSSYDDYTHILHPY